MTSDRVLHQDVLDALQWDPSIRDDEIAVAVKDGVVTLGGFVESYAAKRAADAAIARIPGVRAIVEELQVRLPGVQERTDVEIAHAAIEALRWHVEVPHEAVKVKVERGWITLDGTVAHDYQRHAAEQAVRYLTGVRGVTDHIVVKPAAVSPADVGQRIRDALRRNAEVDASGITVEARGGVVTLRGRVRSLAERRDAESAAWAAPGVLDVDDRITVEA